jgi:ornithine--oxo-acid transaminase
VTAAESSDPESRLIVLPQLEQEAAHGVNNYAPLPVVIARADGSWVRDVHGERYFDALSAYSALNFGHRHPRLIAAAQAQLNRLTLTSRAFHNDQLGPFCAELATVCGRDRVLPSNTGGEAVEAAIKTARKWGYEARGVAPGQARIIACHRNFHGRTTTIISFSDDPQAVAGFGPFTPGFDLVPHGDANALRAAITHDTVAFLFEPVQGEAGVIVPPDGYIKAVREICDEAGILMIADEIQSGLGRTGRRFACDWEDVVPDIWVLGKALGGGIMPLSAIVADDEVLGLYRPGQHGSTFGGNPLACAIGREVLELLADGSLADRARVLGEAFATVVRAADHPVVLDVRQRGLWIAIELRPGASDARAVCEDLLRARVLAKDTYHTTVRLAPPLTSDAADLEWVQERVNEVLAAHG